MQGWQVPRWATVERDVGVFLFLVFVALTALTSQRDFSYVLEPDVPLGWTRSWMAFLSSADLDTLTRPFAYTNLDGQSVPLAIAALIAKALFPGYSNNDSYVLMGAIAVNVLSWAGAGVVFYVTMLRLTGNIIVSAALAMLFVISPQMLAINLARADYQIMLPLMAVIYCSVVIAEGEERTRHAVVLGVSFAFLASIKISGPIFAVFPLLAATTRAWPGDAARYRKWGQLILIAFVVFVPLYAVLMFRFLYHFTWDELISLYPDGANVFFSWRDLYQYTPRWYYSYQILLQHYGYEFIALYIGCAVLLFVLSLQLKERPALFLVLSLVVFSIVASFTQKYGRGGYHLLPLFLLVIGLAAMRVTRMNWPEQLRIGIPLVIFLVLGSSALRAMDYYRSRITQAELRTIAINDVIRTSDEYLRQQVAPGSTICVWRDSLYATPHLQRLGAQIVSGPFHFPYTDNAAFGRYAPPTLSEVEKQCDVVVTNSMHFNGFAKRMREFSPYNQDRWDDLLKQMAEAHPPKRFEASTQAEGIPAWIDVYAVKTGMPHGGGSR
jgi:hypothetical protein